MRSCPVCLHPERTEIFVMGYRTPDGWPLPDVIHWYTCDKCDMIYGDGDFGQSMLDDYYRRFYGYGVNNPMNIERLRIDAVQIETMLGFDREATVIDFGGAGDDGSSIIVEVLKKRGFTNAICTGAGDVVPNNCDVIYTSHVLEHIYNLPAVMQNLRNALAQDGTLMVDVPNSTGLLSHWKMPILDFNTKHINHFTLRNLLDLGYQHGLEMVKMHEYRLENAPAFQVHFRFLNVAQASADHIQANISERIEKLRAIDYPVNIWGMSDIVWHILSQVDFDVLDYIDNDPAYRGQTYKGKPVLEMPTNDAPIVIMAQGQRGRLIENIRRMGITNRIVEI